MRPVLRTLRFLMPLAAVAVLGFASSVHAQIVNGSFQAGDYTGYSPVGNASVESLATIGETPTNGTYEALIQTTNASTGAGNEGNPSTLQTAAQLDAFLGDGTFLQTNPSNFTNGSAFKQTFSATAGSSLKFDTNFLTNELNTSSGGNPDQAFVELLNGTTLVGFLSLGTPNQATTTTPMLDTFFDTETGYTTTTLAPSDFTTTGSYTLEFVVLNASSVTPANGEANDSGLLVDNINLNLGAGGGTVPLPAGAWAGLIGCALALGVGFKMTRKAAV